MSEAPNLELPTPPEELYFKIESFGRGWLALTLRSKATDEVLAGQVVERPDPSFYNLPVQFTPEKWALEVTQTSSLKGVARHLLASLTKEIAEDEQAHLKAVEDFQREHYLGDYHR